MSTLVTGGGDLRLAAGTGTVQISAPTDTNPTGEALVLTLPQTIGSANQVLKNSGTAGTLEFGSAPTLTTTSADVSLSGTSGTTFTGIDANIKRVVMHWRDVSHGTQGEEFAMRIGPSSGVITSSTYRSQDSFINGGSSHDVTGTTSGDRFRLAAWTNPANIMTGCLTFDKIGENKYFMYGQLFTSFVPNHWINWCGWKNLSGPLERIQVYTNSGNNFDGGTVNITQYF